MWWLNALVCCQKVVATLCEGSPTHGRKLKKSHFVERALEVCLNMMCEREDDPGWEMREQLDQDDDDDDSTNRGMGEEVLSRLAEVVAAVDFLCRCVAALLCGCVAVWLCGCVAVCLCGCVAVWLCG